MISMAYGRGAKRFISLGEMALLILLIFPPGRSAKRNGREIDGGLRARAADGLRLFNSEMAPQALEITQNGLAKMVSPFAVASS